MTARRRLTALAALLLCAALLVGGCGSGSGSGSGGEDGATGDGGSGGGRFAAASTLPPGLAGRAAAPIRLTDARSGQPFDSATLKGRPYLVTFLFVNCPDVCPLIGQELRQTLEQLGPQAGDVAVVAVSVDPRHDTADAVKTWLRRQRQPDNFHYLIGSEQELEPVWRGFYAAPQVQGDPDSAHTAVVWLVDGQGRLQGKVAAGASFEPSELAADVRTLLSER